jgi:ABC-type transport system involved in multi-copper enzyme maturation permease subunit
MLTTIKYVLIVAMRDRLIAVLIAGLLGIVGISHALSSTMMIEQQQTALVFNAASARLLLIIGIIVFVAFHIRQAFDSKEIDVILSRPISRGQLISAYWIGFACVGTLLTMASAITSLLLAPMNMQGFALWCLSMLCEIWLMSAITLFTSLVLTSAVTSVITSIAIYILSRMMGFFLATVHSRYSIDTLIIHKILRHGIDTVSMLTPRLDFFSESSWLLYGAEKHFLHAALPFATQTMIFIPLILLAAILDMRKKQF